MCLAECRQREQATLVNETRLPMFEMVPHWPGIIQSQTDGFFLTRKLLNKQSLLDHKGILRLAFEFPPIMLPRKVIS